MRTPSTSMAKSLILDQFRLEVVSDTREWFRSFKGHVQDLCSIRLRLTDS